jgi:hypothetical protein
MNTFYEYFEFCKSKKIKFTVILGSGYHKEALGNHSILSNWETLLSKLSNSNNFTKNLTLEFEKILKIRTSLQNEKAVSIIEKKELEYIASHISHEQDWILSQEDRFIYPNIFNPKHVSDVISLNFDYIAEEKTKNWLNYKKNITWKNQSSFSDKKTYSIYRYTSYRGVKNKEGEEIRFWYPHGSVHGRNKDKNIVLGTYRYSNLVSHLFRIRRYYKDLEKQKIKDLTWYSQLIENPVIFLGASVSEAEWALWTAMVYKKRNYAKGRNNKSEYKSFQMMDIKDNYSDDFWNEPLFYNIDFKSQWEKLEELFNQ